MTVHGALRHVLTDEVAQLTRKIEAYLSPRRRNHAASPGFGDLGTINPGLLLHRLWLDADRDEVATALREAHLREDSVHETGLTLSPTYGVPVLPGTALKGLAAAAARDREAGWSDLDTTLFGSPRPGQASPARRGSVLVWDGLPIDSPKLVLDVLTPHVKDYYDSGNTKATPDSAPAEYHNPVPIRFLAVERTSFRAYLIGPPADVTRCVELIRSGLDELGTGGKTAAGYGYGSSPEEEFT